MAGRLSRGVQSRLHTGSRLLHTGGRLAQPATVALRAAPRSPRPPWPLAVRWKRQLPPSILVAPQAATRLGALLATQPDAIAVRLGMMNDWGSPTGFSYTLNFVKAGGEDPTDERIDLPSGAALFVERKALWVGEGGLLGASVDMDENFNLIVDSKTDGQPERGSAGLTADEVARRGSDG